MARRPGLASPAPAGTAGDRGRAHRYTMASSPSAPLASASSPERSEHWLFCVPLSSLSPASDASSPPGEARRHASGWAARCQEGHWTLSGPSEGLPPPSPPGRMCCALPRTQEGALGGLCPPGAPPASVGEGRGGHTPRAVCAPPGTSGDVRSALEAGDKEARPRGCSGGHTHRAP